MPTNLVMDRRGVLDILDLGLAKIAEDFPAETNDTRLKSLRPLDMAARYLSELGRASVSLWRGSSSLL